MEQEVQVTERISEFDDEVGERAANALEGGEDPVDFDLRGAAASVYGLMQPAKVTKAAIALSAEWLQILLGTSDVSPDKKDWRFRDPAWVENPIYRRLAQSYLSFCDSMEKLVPDDGDWRNRERAKFGIELLTTALAPTNTLLGNPAAIKRAFETGGKSLADGTRNFVHDLLHNGGMPTQVNLEPFKKGENLAATPGSVVFRNEILEIIQYTPTTAKVRRRPTLVITPQINKYYFLDLSPGRSFVEFAVNQGIQPFMVSWRNPTSEQGHWNLDSYLEALLEAIDAIRDIAGTEDINTFGFCAGGITMSALLGHLAAIGDERVHAAGFAVTLLDFDVPAMIGMLQSDRLLDAAKARSKSKGVLSGKDLARLFAWFRPNDLVWNYWVNNYLMGKPPPSFDILAWNADSTNLPGGLHADFLDIFAHNHFTRPGSLTAIGTPVDLSRVKCDTFVTGALNDHLTPWKGCYRTTQLVGGDCTFVLSNAGHIASLVNPPGNPKSSYFTGAVASPDPDEWKANAVKHQGTWWEQWAKWIDERSGEERQAPRKLGNKRWPALDPAPGRYIG